MSIKWKEIAKKKGEIVATTEQNIIKLEEKGESFIGKYITSSEVQIGDNEPFTSFQFETEKGMYSFSGGQGFNQSMRMIDKGSIIRVTFLGKKKTGAGYKMNVFSIEMLQGKINEKERKAIKEELAKKFAGKKKKSVKKAGKND